MATSAFTGALSGAKISILGLSVGMDVNIFGSTSVTIGIETKKENEMHFDGFTVGINTPSLIGFAVSLYAAFTTGDFSGISVW